MKFLKTLLGKDTDEIPSWDIRPPSERPPPRGRKPVEETPVSAPAKKKKLNPLFDDDAMNSLQLEAEAIPDDNPYQTSTWEQDLENDTRKLKTIAIGEKTERKPDSQFNPYDTGKMKRSWKK